MLSWARTHCPPCLTCSASQRPGRRRRRVGHRHGHAAVSSADGRSRSPAAGATMSRRQCAAPTTDADRACHASLPAHRARYTLQATPRESVASTEATVCVHNGNDGTCGTTVPAIRRICQRRPAPRQSYRPALHRTAHTRWSAKASSVIEGPRLRRGARARASCSGSVLAHTAVTSHDAPRAAPRYKGRCSSFNGATSASLAHAAAQRRLLQGGQQRVFSYLLPAALPPGRYVLDIEARRRRGQPHDAREGVSRIVFYVR